jgi:hypothetical protein
MLGDFLLVPFGASIEEPMSQSAMRYYKEVRCVYG